jgi:hypothetical protein
MCGFRLNDFTKKTAAPFLKAKPFVDGFQLSIFFFHVFFDFFECLGADDVLDAAGVLVRRIAGYAQGLHQEFCDDPVAVVYFVRLVKPFLGEQDLPAFLNRVIIRVFKDADRAADTGFCIIQFVRDVHRTDKAKFVLKYQYGFEVVFTRLVYIHVSLLYAVIVISCMDK